MWTKICAHWQRNRSYCGLESAQNRPARCAAWEWATGWVGVHSAVGSPLHSTPLHGDVTGSSGLASNLKLKPPELRAEPPLIRTEPDRIGPDRRSVIGSEPAAGSPCPVRKLEWVGLCWGLIPCWRRYQSVWTSSSADTNRKRFVLLFWTRIRPGSGSAVRRKSAD